MFFPELSVPSCVLLTLHSSEQSSSAEEGSNNTDYIVKFLSGHANIFHKHTKNTLTNHIFTPLNMYDNLIPSS